MHSMLFYYYPIRLSGIISMCGRKTNYNWITCVGYSSSTFLSDDGHYLVHNLITTKTRYQSYSTHHDVAYPTLFRGHPLRSSLDREPLSQEHSDKTQLQHLTNDDISSFSRNPEVERHFMMVSLLGLSFRPPFKN